VRSPQYALHEQHASFETAAPRPPQDEDERFWHEGFTSS
jgi:hypothetical protein